MIHTSRSLAGDSEREKRDGTARISQGDEQREDQKQPFLDTGLSFRHSVLVHRPHSQAPSPGHSRGACGQGPGLRRCPPGTFLTSSSLQLPEEGCGVSYPSLQSLLAHSLLPQGGRARVHGVVRLSQDCPWHQQGCAKWTLSSSTAAVSGRAGLQSRADPGAPGPGLPGSSPSRIPPRGRWAGRPRRGRLGLSCRKLGSCRHGNLCILPGHHLSPTQDLDSPLLCLPTTAGGRARGPV